MPELEDEFNDFIDDSDLKQFVPDDLKYVPDECGAISFDEDGNEVVCTNLKNPAEQLCFMCLRG